MIADGAGRPSKSCVLACTAPRIPAGTEATSGDWGGEPIGRTVDGSQVNGRQTVNWCVRTTVTKISTASSATVAPTWISVR